MALEQAGVGKRKETTTKRVNVEIAGRRTSLTLSRNSLDKLSLAKGTKQQAKAVIQDLANTAPMDVENRSAWVEERLHGYLTLMDRDGPSLAHH